jgi:hypothetical protein
VFGQLEPHWLKLVKPVCLTPVTGSQESVVHELPSSMFTGVWVIAPVLVLQASVVQASLSVTLTAVCLTPVTGSHESVVQALLSFTAGGVPGEQLPEPSQVSTPSHTVALPQAVPDATKVFAHLFAVQVSLVQGLPSAQSAGLEHAAPPPLPPPAPPPPVPPLPPPPALVPPALVPPALVPPALVPPALVPPALVPPALVPPALVPPALVPPALVVPPLPPPPFPPTQPPSPTTPPLPPPAFASPPASESSSSSAPSKAVQPIKIGRHHATRATRPIEPLL